MKQILLFTLLHFFTPVWSVSGADVYSQQLSKYNKTTGLQFSNIDTASINTLNRLAKEAIDSIQLDKGFIYVTDAKLLSEKFGYKKGKADALTNEGVLLAKRKQYKQALALHYEALQIYMDLKNDEGIRYGYCHLARCYQWLNLYTEASSYFFKSMKLAEAAKDSFLLYKTLSGTAYLLQFMGNLNESIAYQKKAIAYVNTLENKEAYCMGLIFLADYYALNNDYAVADSILKIAYQKAVEFKSPRLLSYYYNINSQVEEQRNNYGKAILSLLNSNKIEATLPVTENLPYNYANIANYILQADKTQLAIAGIPLNEKYDEAIRYAQLSLDITLPAGIVNMTSANYYHIGIAYEKKGNFEQALRYSNMHRDIKDSLFNAKNMETIQDLKLKYETEKKEQQIKILANESKVKSIAAEKEKQQKNFAFIGIAAMAVIGVYIFNLYSKRKKLSNQLSQSLTDLKSTQQQLIQIEREKEAENIRLRISRDIHDDIGHSLTKISLLSDMTASDKEINSPAAIETLGRISNYSRNVNSSLSEIVWAISPKHDSLDSLIVYMRNHIHTFFENMGITYQINFPEAYENRSINPELKRNIFLVLKESLNNILKYAHAKNVSVDFKIDGANFEINIIDDGVGIDLHAIQSRASGERSGGNGLPNMKHRIEQTGGSFQINTSVGNGCVIIAQGKLV